MPFVPHTPEERAEMLTRVGAEAIEDFFECVPESARASALELPAAFDEAGARRLAEELASANPARELLCFAGAGAYDHYIPAAVEQIASLRPFLTSYTPYQAEASQGVLQATFEYQTMVASLTGLDVSNASLYDGSTALWETAKLAAAATRRKRVLADRSLNPTYRACLRTYLSASGMELVELDYAPNGGVNAEALGSALDDDAAAVVAQYPNFFGRVDDLSTLGRACAETGAVLIVCADLLALAALKPPGEMGAELACGSGQSLGLPLSFGGPHFGYIAAKEKHVRRLPGRVVGETTDRSGRRAFVLTLQTREQHIRRSRAASNICTNAAHSALRACAYLTLVGPEGLGRAARGSYLNARSLAEELSALPGVRLRFDGMFFREFVMTVPGDANELLARLARKGILGGVALGRWYEELGDSILVCATEKRTPDELARYVAAAKEALP